MIKTRQIIRTTTSCVNEAKHETALTIQRTEGETKIEFYNTKLKSLEYEVYLNDTECKILSAALMQEVIHD